MKNLFVILTSVLLVSCGIRAEKKSAESSPIRTQKKINNPLISPSGGDLVMSPSVASIFFWPEYNSDLSYIDSTKEMRDTLIKKYPQTSKENRELVSSLEALAHPALDRIVRAVVHLAAKVDTHEIEKEELLENPEFALALQISNEYLEKECDFPEDENIERCDELIKLQDGGFRDAKSRYDTTVRSIQGRRSGLSDLIKALMDVDPENPKNYLLGEEDDVLLKILPGNRFYISFKNFGPYKVHYTTENEGIQDVEYDVRNRFLDFRVVERVPVKNLSDHLKARGFSIQKSGESDEVDIEKLPREVLASFVEVNKIDCLNLDDLRNPDIFEIQTCREYVFEMEIGDFKEVGKTRISGSMNLEKNGVVVRRGSAKFDGQFN